MVLYLQDREAEQAVLVPTAVPGRNELIHVVAALEEEGLDVETLTGANGVRSTMLETVGQPLSIDGAEAYVFIYPDAATRDQATLDVLPEDVDLKSNAGEPIGGAGVRLFTGSNVAVVLVSGDEGLGEKITSALGRLR